MHDIDRISDFIIIQTIFAKDCFLRFASFKSGTRINEEFHSEEETGWRSFSISVKHRILIIPDIPLLLCVILYMNGRSPGDMNE